MNESSPIFRLILGAAVVGILGTANVVVPSGATIAACLGYLFGKRAVEDGLNVLLEQSSSMITRWLKRSRQRGLELLRDDHLRRLLSKALEAKLAELGTREHLEPALRARLPVLARHVARHLASSTLPAGLERLDEAAAMKLLTGGLQDADGSFGVGTWDAFIRDLDESSGDGGVAASLAEGRQLRREARAGLAQLLSREFPETLLAVMQGDFAGRDSAAAALQLRLTWQLAREMGELTAGRNRLDAPERQQAESLQALGGALDQRLPALLGMLDEANRVRLSELADDVRASLGQMDRTLSAIADDAHAARTALETVLGRELQKPWVTATPFPFDYSHPSTRVFGVDASSILGREVESFLSDARETCWWLWTGLEGTGKSRLAMETCRSLANWDAGFVDVDARKRLLAATTRRWTLDRHTLIVLDNVGTDPRSVRGLLCELLARFKGGDHRLRILLLERHGSALSGEEVAGAPHWLRELFDDGPGRLTTDEILSSQHPNAGAPSRHLTTLAADEARELALTFAGTFEGHGDASWREKLAGQALAILGADVRPLNLLVTMKVLHHSSEGDRKEIEKFEQVMRRWLHERITLRCGKLRDAGAGDERAVQVLNLVSLATVVGEVHLDGGWMDASACLPSASELTADILRAVEQEADAPIRGVTPHLIGEWYVYLRARLASEGGVQPHLSPSELANAVSMVPDSTAAVGAFIQRTCRTFSREPLWRLLRNVIGRYGTPFGHLFDSGKLQALLLGGTSAEASEHYRAEVFRRVDELSANGKPVHVLNLMAGGSHLPGEIATRHGNVRVLAIDRDVSRLHEGPAVTVVKAEIDESTDIGGHLDDAFGRETCDLVIAKKALHELTWKQQRRLIRQLGGAVRSGGAVVLYTDSPASGRHADWIAWDREMRARLPIDATDASLTVAGEWLMAERFDESQAACFMNAWIRMKDWANYNRHEWERRYFSSAEELHADLHAAGFVPEDGGVRSHHMELHAPRFVEEAINRLAYLLTEPSVTDAELASAFTSNARSRLFESFSQHHLGPDEQHRTPLGAALCARRPPGFDLAAFLAEELGPRARHVEFPTLTGLSFRMPVHVFSLRRV